MSRLETFVDPQTGEELPASIPLWAVLALDMEDRRIFPEPDVDLPMRYLIHMGTHLRRHALAAGVKPLDLTQRVQRALSQAATRAWGQRDVDRHDMFVTQALRSLQAQAPDRTLCSFLSSELVRSGRGPYADLRRRCSIVSSDLWAYYQLEIEARRQVVPLVKGGQWATMLDAYRRGEDNTAEVMGFWPTGGNEDE